MKTLKYIVFFLLIVFIALAIYIAVQPNHFEVSRTKTIQAPASVVYNNVKDFKNWSAWSSWVEKDPEMKITLPEKTDGVGGSYSWEDKDGVGTMKTIEVVANKSITQEMQFAEFPKSDVAWDFKSNTDGSTDVTWSISGKDLPFGFKAFATLMGGMEKQIGPEYERSLVKLDSIVQVDMKKYSITVDKQTTQHSGGFYIYNTTSCKMDEYEDKMREMFPAIQAYAAKNNITPAGAPFTLYHKWDQENNAAIFSCCIPTSARVITTESDVLTGQLKPFKAVKTRLNGSYDNLKETWETAMAEIAKSGLELTENGPMLEAYLNNLMNTPNPADLKTEIFIAVK